MKKIYFILATLLLIQYSYGQNDVTNLIGALLGDTPIEEDLEELVDEIGGRVTGSKANERAVEWGLQKFNSAGVKAWKDPFEMPILWLGESTKCVINGLDFEPLAISKYNVQPGLYDGKLIYAGMGTAEDMDQLGADVKGAFLLVESDLCLDIDGLFAEYAAATTTEMEAYHRGAKGIIFMSSRPNKLLYRFLTSKVTDIDIIPQIVMAREDAKRIARSLQRGKKLSVSLDVKAKTGPSFTSHNVIAEIPGTEKPEQIIVIGAHIDSWALGTGANDNGCNVSMMIDIARQMKKLGIQGKRTIRFALWNGEEQGYFGSWDYTKEHEAEMKNHKMALSVDIGSGAITGFFTNGREELVKITDHVLKPISALADFSQINAPIVGTDNFDFMLQGVPNLVANHKPQLYGPNYHASSDTFDKVDLKQVKRNSAIIGALALGYANLDQKTAAQLDQQTRAEVQSIFDTFKLEFTMRMFNVWEPWANGERGIK